jgi:hypothetical protein
MYYITGRRGGARRLLIRAAVESDVVLSQNSLLSLLLQLRRVCEPEGPGVSCVLSVPLHDLAEEAGADLAALLRASGLEQVGERPPPPPRPPSGASGSSRPPSRPASRAGSRPESRVSFARA